MRTQKYIVIIVLITVVSLVLVIMIDEIKVNSKIIVRHDCCELKNKIRLKIGPQPAVAAVCDAGRQPAELPVATSLRIGLQLV